MDKYCSKCHGFSDSFCLDCLGDIITETLFAKMTEDLTSKAVAKVLQEVNALRAEQDLRERAVNAAVAAEARLVEAMSQWKEELKRLADVMTEVRNKASECEDLLEAGEPVPEVVSVLREDIVYEIDSLLATLDVGQKHEWTGRRTMTWYGKGTNQTNQYCKHCGWVAFPYTMPCVGKG